MPSKDIDNAPNFKIRSCDPSHAPFRVNFHPQTKILTWSICVQNLEHVTSSIQNLQNLHKDPKFHN